MSRSREEAHRWMAQAVNDLDFAKVGVREGFYAQACFLCQQAAEKGLKALHYARGERLVIGHSVWQLIRPLLDGYPKLVAFSDLAKQLDQYYIAPRYPNSLPSGAPFEVFTKDQARSAIEGVAELLAVLQRYLQEQE